MLYVHPLPCVLKLEETVSRAENLPRSRERTCLLTLRDNQVRGERVERADERPNPLNEEKVEEEISHEETVGDTSEDTTTQSHPIHHEVLTYCA